MSDRATHESVCKECGGTGERFDAGTRTFATCYECSSAAPDQADPAVERVADRCPHCHHVHGAEGGPQGPGAECGSTEVREGLSGALHWCECRFVPSTVATEDADRCQFGNFCDLTRGHDGKHEGHFDGPPPEGDAEARIEAAWVEYDEAVYSYELAMSVLPQYASTADVKAARAEVEQAVAEKAREDARREAEYEYAVGSNHGGDEGLYVAESLADARDTLRRWETRGMNPWMERRAVHPWERFAATTTATQDADKEGED